MVIRGKAECAVSIEIDSHSSVAADIERKWKMNRLGKPCTCNYGGWRPADPKDIVKWVCAFCLGYMVPK